MGAFVGREHERAAIERLVAEVAASGSVRVAFVLGAPGSGKSRLLGEVRRVLGPARPLDVVGYEPEREIPLAASRQLLRRLARGHGAGARLERLVFSGTGAEPLDALRLFDAAERSLAESAVAAIIVDDLQWVDRSSLALLHYLLRTAAEAGRGLLVVVAARPTSGAYAFEASIRDALARTDGQVLTLELGPLERDAGIELARSVAGRLSAADAEDLWQQADGSPFWIEMLARGGRSGDLEAMITMRLRGTGPDARQALGLAAIAGRPITDDEVASMLDWPPERARTATSTLVDRGLAVVIGDGTRLSHDLVRDAVLERLPPRERMRLHWLLAAHLERVADDDPRTLRAALEHRYQGGLRTVELALRVARSPQRRLIDADGLALLARSADEAPSGDTLALALSVELARLAGDIGRPLLALERWADVRPRLTSPVERAAAALEASRVALRIGHNDEAAALADAARSVDGLPPALAIELEVHEGLILRHVRHEPEAGRAGMRHALDAARALAEAAGGADALDEAGRRAYLNALFGAYDVARLDDDDADAMLELADEAAAIPSTSDPLALGARFNGGVALRTLGRWDDAATRLGRAFEEALRLSYPMIAADTGYWLADSLRVLGRWEDATRVARETIELGRRVEDRRAVSDGRWVILVTRLWREDWPAAVAEIEREVRDEPDPHYRIEAQDTLARWLARVGGLSRVSEALEHLQGADTDSARAACRRCRSESTLGTIGTLALLGRHEEAGRLADEWDRASPRPNPVAAMRRRWVAGLLGSAAGDSGLADLDAAAEAAGAMGMRPETVWLRIDAAAAVERTDLGESIDRLLAARHLAGELGATTQKGVIDTTLKRLGVRTWRRGPSSSSGDVLTGRAREVARLVASGASNPEIAASLFLSRKTVESHVSALLARFEVRNRTELATRLGETAALDAPE